MRLHRARSNSRATSRSLDRLHRHEAWPSESTNGKNPNFPPPTFPDYARLALVHGNVQPCHGSDWSCCESNGRILNLSPPKFQQLDFHQLIRIGGVAVAYHLLTTIIAVLKGIGLVLLIQPGHGVELFKDVAAKCPVQEETSAALTLLDLVT